MWGNLGVGNRMYQQRTALHQSMLYICCIKCTPSNKWLKVKGEGSKLWSRMGAGCDGRMLASLSAIGPTCPSVCSSCSATQLTLFTNNQHCQLSVAGGGLGPGKGRVVMMVTCNMMQDIIGPRTLFYVRGDSCTVAGTAHTLHQILLSGNLT